MTRFCEECGSILIPNRNEGNVTFKCMKCGKEIVNDHSTESMVVKKKIKHDEKSKTVIITDENKYTSEGTVRAECPKCHHNEATTYYLQTRSGDEGSTQFYQCTKCGKKWRDYG